ncbi:MAG: hypothetical protein KBS54_05965 [Synergistaceae bacterium]|nr:hypothetical protein [Candidatus Equadaptatus faecalis]
MDNNSWIAKITMNGQTVCAQIFDNERIAVAFIQRTALALKDKCVMKLLYHTIHITEETTENYPQHFPLSSRKRDIVIIEADFKDKF